MTREALSKHASKARPIRILIYRHRPSCAGIADRPVDRSSPFQKVDSQPPGHPGTILNPMPDVIAVNQLAAHILGAGPSAFGLAALPSPVEITLRIELEDSVVPNDADSMPGLGVNYSSVSKAVYAAVSGKSFANPAAILSTAARVPLALEAVKAVEVRAVLPRALLQGTCAYERRYESLGEGRSTQGELRGRVEGMSVTTVIGLHPHERAEKQRLEVDVAVSDVPEGWGHKAFADDAYKVSSHQLSSSSTKLTSVPRVERVRNPRVLRGHVRPPSPVPRQCPGAVKGGRHIPQAQCAPLRDAEYLCLAHEGGLCVQRRGAGHVDCGDHTRTRRRGG